MSTHENDDRPEHDARPEQEPATETFREREIIVTGGEGRRSGAGTAVVVIFALVALAVIVFVAFTILDRSDDGDGILPGDVDITIEVPRLEDGS